MAGRPPYTKEQIEALTTDDEKKRAIAEIQSMENEGTNENNADNASATGYIARLAREGGNSTTEAHRSTGNSSHSGAASNYQRHHPYQHQGPRYKNRSLTFNKPATPNKSSASNSPGTLTISKTSIGATPKQSELTEATTTALPGPADVRTTQQRTEPRRPCPTFTRTGVCSRKTCYNAHDFQKLAICKVWLFKGECAKGAYCPLSHTSSPHNAPTCMHFQNGRCNNEECRFAHVRVNPAAPNCEAFGLVGYCEKGSECAELHAHECPHFSNTGSCRFGDNCRLGHIRRASRMKNKSGRNSEERTSPTAVYDELLSNTASLEGDDDRTDSDAARVPHDFTQQVDFVPLVPDG